jgi:hypothetical protein
MYKLQRLGAVAVLALLAYLLLSNWKLAETRPLAEATACGADGCPSREPSSSARDPFRHRYAWRVGGDEIEVTCRRGVILLGAWKCKVDRAPAAAVEGRDDMTQYPHQTERGAP